MKVLCYFCFCGNFIRTYSVVIEIFKRTGSMTKLQKDVCHSSINIDLTNLRGLEIAKLKEEDMPVV